MRVVAAIGIIALVNRPPRSARLGPTLAIALLAAAALAGGCASPAERAEKAHARGVELLAKGNRDAAMETFVRVARQAEQAGLDSMVAVAEGNIGSLFFEARDLDRAADHLRAAEAAARRTTGHGGLGNILNNLGLIEKARGRRDAAQGLYLEAVAENHRANNRLGEAAALNNLGTLAREGGEIEPARDLFLRALGLARIAEDSVAIGRSLLSIGDLDAGAGRHDDASDAYAQALEALKVVAPDSPEVGYAYLRRGNLHEDLGDLAEAQRLYLSSLAHYRRIGNAPGEAAAAAGLGSIAIQEGRAAEAESYFVEALPAIRASGNIEELSTHLGRLAAARRAKGDVPGAVQAYQEALGARERLGDSRGYAAVAMNLATLLEGAGDLANAGTAYLAARRALEAAGDTAALREVDAGIRRIKARGPAVAP